MSIAALALAMGAIAETLAISSGKKPPRNRLVIAKPDEMKRPEAR